VVVKLIRLFRIDITKFVEPPGGPGTGMRYNLLSRPVRLEPRVVYTVNPGVVSEVGRRALIRRTVASRPEHRKTRWLLRASGDGNAEDHLVLDELTEILKVACIWMEYSMHALAWPTTHTNTPPRESLTMTFYSCTLDSNLLNVRIMLSQVLSV
jgi:hypothetical protein